MKEAVKESDTLDLKPLSGIKLMNIKLPATYYYTLFSLIIFVFYLVYLPQSGYATLYYDAEQYWQFGDAFFKDGEFSFLNYNIPLRGYLFPFLHLLLSKTADVQPIVLTRIAGAFYAALLFGVAVPFTWRAVKPHSKQHWVQHVIFTVLGFVFWRDYFNFSLTDFPAFLMLLLSILLVFRKPGVVAALVAGMFLSAAVNFRPIYIVSVPFVVSALFLVKNNTSLIRKFINFSVVVVGFLLISLPQLIINIHHYDLYSPLVEAKYDENAKSLYLQQLEWGVVMQKYETNVGTDYPSPRLIYNDPVGKAILTQDNIQEVKDYNEYLQLVYKHPVAFAGMYFRHLFNGLDLQYATPYIREVMPYNFVLVFLNYTILFFAILIVFSAKLKKLEVKHWLMLGALLLPCLLVVPTAIECRFLIPLHFIVYALVCFNWPEKWRWKTVPTAVKLKTAALYVLFLIVSVTISAYTQANLELLPRLF